MKSKHAQITAMHYCIPAEKLTQKELEQRFSVEQVAGIAKLSGIVERRVAPDGVTAVDLAECAITQLLQGYAVDPEEIDGLIFASQTGDYQIPASACVLHGRLGFGKHCMAFDVGLGCSAFPYGLSIANGLIASGACRKVLLVNADTLTKVIHPRDRGLVPLHGDGAVVTLLEGTTAENVGLLGVELGTDGSGARHLMMPASGARQRRTQQTGEDVIDDSGSVSSAEHLQMNGPAVFQFSIREVPRAISRALDNWQLTVEEIDLLLLHQANKMMLDLIYKKLGVPADKQFLFMQQVGNMSGASAPMVLAEALRSGRLRGGERVVLAAFGVGLSWGVVQLQLASDLKVATDVPVTYRGRSE